MFVVGRLALSIVLLGLLAGVASAAAPKKPADHHGFRWGSQRLLCTSVKAERRPNDKVVVTYKGRRYWCSRPPQLGTAAASSEAMGLAIQQRFVPGSTYRWQVALPGCKRTGAAVFACSVNVPQLQAAGTVTWTSSGPRVAFTSFVCGAEAAGRAGC